MYNPDCRYCKGGNEEWDVHVTKKEKRKKEKEKDENYKTLTLIIPVMEVLIVEV